MSLMVFPQILNFINRKCFYLTASAAGIPHQVRYRNRPKPQLRIPYWYQIREHGITDEKLTDNNEKFISQMVDEKYSKISIAGVDLNSPLKELPLSGGKWFPGCNRTGLIGIKLGYIPQWLKDGSCCICTLIQIVDNQVIKYIPPGFEPELRGYALKYKGFTKDLGDLVVGAVNINPQTCSKSYYQLFKKSGTMPKKILTKFPIHPNSIIQPGTPLYAAHFQVGDYLDISGITIYRGFQGVMKRWGFSGQPASHGQTKTHRRPGCIGEGHRVWPGKKMPGDVGNKLRTSRGLKLLRINHKHNILYVKGSIPGDINSVVYVHDTLDEKKVRLVEPRFPTFYPEKEKALSEEEFDEEIFNFSDPTIMFEKEKKSKSKKKVS